MIGDSLGLPSSDVVDVLTAACAAPSLHNSQPWLFTVLPDRIEIRIDPGRRLPVADPDGREQRLAIGAAVFNARLALLQLGVRPLVTLCPRQYPGVEAVIARGGSGGLPAADEPLARAIPQRHTNRKPFSNAVVAAQDRSHLARAAELESGWLAVISDADQRARLHALLGSANADLMADPAYREEFARWVGRTAGQDGVPLSAAGPAPAAHDRWTIRDFGAGRAPQRLPGEDFESEPLLAVLASHIDGRYAQLQSGQALQRVLLTATSLGLSVSFLSQLIEVTRTRGDLHRLIGPTLYPQAVLRIGHGGPVAATPRLPADSRVAEAERRPPTRSPV
jgi:nitroreductase